MFKDPSIKKGIITSIIASIFFMIFIRPILNFVWKGIVIFSNNIYIGFINTIYRNAALGHRNYLSVYFLIFLLFVSAIILWIIFSPLKERFNDQVKKEDSRPSKKISKALLIKRVKLYFILYYISYILLIFCSLIMVTFSFADLQLNTSFQQRITVLASHIADKEYKEFQALWASMKSRNDYLTIKEQMENIAKSKNIELPKPLLD